MSSTSSEYPEVFDTFEQPNTGDKVNDVVKSHSNLHKKVNSAIENIEATLGTNPQGGYSSIAERIGSMQLVQDLAIGVPTYVQATDPATIGPYLWWDISIPTSPTLWIEDGL